MYNRQKAVDYAKKWAYSRNPQYYDFQNLGGDCTNFASQVIYTGCGVMNYTPVYGWYYISLNNRTPSWTGVNQLYEFLTKNTAEGPRGTLIPLSEVQPGDIIQLDFQGDDSFDHTPVVTDAGSGTPDTILVAAHTNDAACRPLSSYNYKKYRALKITCP